MLAGDFCGDASPGREGSHNVAAARRTSGNEIVQQAIYHTLVIDSLVAEPLEIEFQRLQLDTAVVGHVRVGNCAEVGLAGLGTDTGKLRADDLDGEIAPGIGIGKRFQLAVVRQRCVGLRDFARTCPPVLVLQQPL